MRQFLPTCRDAPCTSLSDGSVGVRSEECVWQPAREAKDVGIVSLDPTFILLSTTHWANAITPGSSDPLGAPLRL